MNLTRRDSLGRPIAERERAILGPILAPMSAPSADQKGVQTLEGSTHLRWLIKSPDDVVVYSVQLFRWSAVLGDWFEDGEPHTGLTGNQVLTQIAGGPLHIRLFDFASSATGFRVSVAGFTQS